VGARRYGQRYLGKMEGHGFGIAKWQDQTGALAKIGTDGTEDVGRFRPLILGRRRPRTPPGPAPRDLVLLTDAGFVLKPYLYGRAEREGRSDLCQRGGKAFFLNDSMANSFWAWWRGRAVSLT